MAELMNWGRTHAATPSAVLRPTSEAEVAELVKTARQKGQRVKVMGALHSWSDCAMPDQLAMTLDGMQGVLETGAETARILAGTRLHQINAALDELGLAMPILGSVAEQSIGGAISTGTHGSSTQHPNMAARVRSMRLVTGTGEILELGPADPRLDAARVSLGALGIVTEVTLDVVPAFRLAEVSTPMPLAEAIAKLDTLADSAEFVKLWWLPHTGMAMVFAADRTTEHSEYSPLGRWVDEAVVNRWLFRGVLGLGQRLPRVIPRLNRLVRHTYFRPRRVVAKGHRIFNIAMPPIHREMEYAIPKEAAPEALEQMAAWLDSDSVRVNFVVEVRFVKGDTGWMSPASGRDSCQIGAYIGRSADVQRYYEGFERLMLGLSGRPHWGKEFFADADDIRERYARADDFMALTEELDPDGVFRNPFLDRLFTR